MRVRSTAAAEAATSAPIPGARCRSPAPGQLLTMGAHAAPSSKRMRPPALSRYTVRVRSSTRPGLSPGALRSSCASTDSTSDGRSRPRRRRSVPRRPRVSPRAPAPRSRSSWKVSFPARVRRIHTSVPCSLRRVSNSSIRRAIKPRPRPPALDGLRRQRPPSRTVPGEPAALDLVASSSNQPWAGPYACSIVLMLLRSRPGRRARCRRQ